MDNGFNNPALNIYCERKKGPGYIPKILQISGIWKLPSIVKQSSSMTGIFCSIVQFV